MIRWTIALTASVIGCAVPGAALAQYYPSANPAESRPYRAGPIDMTNDGSLADGRREYRRPVGFEPPRPPARIGESSPRTGPSDPRYAGLRSDDQPSRSIEDGSGAPRPPATIGEPSPLTAGGHPGGHPRYAALPQNDQPEEGDPQELAPQLRRQLVDYRTSEPAGTLIVDTPNTYLYLVLGTGKALRYGIGVGREGFTWSGEERVSRMSQWPDWHPPADMLERQPYLPRFMAGGPGNPLGTRALYLGKSIYRIHGTNQPSTIGKFVSSGCIRLLNEDIEDLYRRVNLGTRVVVLNGDNSASTGAAHAALMR
jgi:lipoprotein-anchoring transpeptidase ErfK/SrfK